jgi:hypothetical protein
MPNVSLSHPITVIKQLCEDFIALSQSHFAISGGDAGVGVENLSSSFHTQSLWRQVGSNPAIAPISTNNGASLTSDIYEMCASNENEDSAAYDLLFSNPLALDFPEDVFHFDAS